MTGNLVRLHRASVKVFWRDKEHDGPVVDWLRDQAGLLPIELVRPKDPAERDTGLLREDHFGEVTWKGRGDMETTEITEKIKDHRSGKITDEELVKYLSEDARYKPGPVNPYESGTPEWWHWSEDGPPFVPGSFAEVELARDNGLLDPDIYEQVLHVFYSQQDKS